MDRRNVTSFEMLALDPIGDTFMVESYVTRWLRHEHSSRAHGDARGNRLREEDGDPDFIHNTVEDVKRFLIFAGSRGEFEHDLLRFRVLRFPITVRQ